MQINPSYTEVLTEVATFLQTRLQAMADLGIGESQVALDPGIGFGKTVEHNFQLLANLAIFRQGPLGTRPLCLGVSRKGFLGRLLGRTVKELLVGSLAVLADALVRQTAQIVRVHDVAATRDLVMMLRGLERYRTTTTP